MGALSAPQLAFVLRGAHKLLTTVTLNSAGGDGLTVMRGRLNKLAKTQAKLDLQKVEQELADKWSQRMMTLLDDGRGLSSACCSCVRGMLCFWRGLYNFVFRRSCEQLLQALIISRMLSTRVCFVEVADTRSCTPTFLRSTRDGVSQK